MRAAILLVAPLAFFVACGGSGGGTPTGPLDVNLTPTGANPKSCTFSDSLNPSNAAFQGSINVLAPGNGY